MASPKLIQVLETFKPEEWSSFKKHISRFYTKNADTYKIFVWIMNKHTQLEKNADIISQLNLHFKNLSAKVILNHLSLLYNLAEQWMVTQQLDHDKETYKLLIHRNMQKRGLYHLADQFSNKLREDFYETADYHFLFTKRELLHQEYYSFNPKKYELGWSALEQLFETTIKFQSHVIQIYLVELINWGKITNTDFTNLEAKALAIISSYHDDLDNKFFYKLYQLMITDDLYIFQELTQRLLNEEWKEGSLEEVISTIYLIRKATEYYSKGLRIDSKLVIGTLYDFAMKRGVFLEHGKLAPITFRNIIINLCQNQSYSDINQFIETWYHQISAPLPESTRNVCHSLNNLKHNKFDAIFEYTRMKTYNDETEKAMSLSMHLIACFMQREADYDLYITTLNNFNSFLKRNKDAFTQRFYLGLFNFIEIMKSVDKKIKVNFDDYKTIYYREWCTFITKSQK